MKLFRLFAVSALAVTVAGCSAIHTGISKRDLDVQNKMSDSIFLEPVAPASRTVYVQVRNTSDRSDFDINGDVRAAIASKGYTVVEDPAKAHYILQANVLQVGRSNKSDAESAFASGFGGALAGATLSHAFGGSGRGTAGAAVAGALLGTIVDASVQDVYYTAITDIQIKERVRGGKASVSSSHTLKQGSSGSSTVSDSSTTQWRGYQTRILSTANKVNLKFEEAAPALRAGVARSISGLF